MSVHVYGCLSPMSNIHYDRVAEFPFHAPLTRNLPIVSFIAFSVLENARRSLQLF